MGEKFLGVDIAGEVHRALSAKLKPATLTKRAVGTRSATDSTAGTNPTEASYSARGFVDDYATSEIDGTLIKMSDRLVVLIADSIEDRQVPSSNDFVTIEGSTYRVVRVARDPATATYECQARR